MKKQHTPLIVGLFVIGAAVLGLIGLLNFGGEHLFGKPLRFVVIMEDVSTSGLDPGSAVKLSGVRIGRVESIKARYRPKKNSIAIRVVCDVDEQLAADVFPPGASMEDLIRGGLHARLRLAGITGLLYLDLSLKPDKRPAEVTYDEQTGTPVVPTAPDTISEVTDALATVSTGLAEVDYRGISEQLTKLLESANRQLEEGNLAATIQSVGAAAESVRALLGNEDIVGTLSNLNSAAGNLDVLITRLNETSPDLAADLQELLRNTSAAMQGITEMSRSANALVSSQSGLPAEAALALDRIQRAAVAIEQLAEYLERNPSALVRGRPRGSGAD